MKRKMRETKEHCKNQVKSKLGFTSNKLVTKEVREASQPTQGGKAGFLSANVIYKIYEPDTKRGVIMIVIIFINYRQGRAPVCR